MLEAGIDDETIRDDLETAMNTTLRFGLSGETPLISGDFGRIELPIRYAELVGDRHWRETLAMLDQASATLSTKIAGARRRDYPALGLMTGLTGVAHQALRIADNTLMAPVLSLSDKPGARPLLQPGSPRLQRSSRQRSLSCSRSAAK